MDETTNSLAVAEPTAPSLADFDVRMGKIGTKSWSSRVRKRARELITMLDTGYMELARILYQVWDTPVDGDPKRAPVYTSWGYESIGEYAQHELNMHPKKAERLRRIWYVLEIQMQDLDPELKQRIVNLGFSKVRELIKVLSVRNAPELVPLAETSTYKQLEVAVIDEGRRRGLAEAVLQSGDDDLLEDISAQAPHVLDTVEGLDVSPEPERPTREVFDLFPAQLANVRLALEKSAQLSHSSKKGHNLDLICTDFLATNDFIGSDPDKRLRFVAKLEKALGLRLVVIDPEAKEFLYGIDALQLVADG